jgi:hypothetical protein
LIEFLPPLTSPGVRTVDDINIISPECLTVFHMMQARNTAFSPKFKPKKMKAAAEATAYDQAVRSDKIL